MAFTDQQVLQWFLDNPNATDAQIAQTAAAAQIPAEQLSRVTSVPVAEIQARVAAAAPGVQLPPSNAGLFSTATQETNSSTFAAPASNNTLGGVILAGDSWLSGTKNTQRISEQLGQPVTNVAVGGFTTQDTINQLNSFLQGGGTFSPNSTVMLDVGGNDLLQNVNSTTVKNNIEQLVKTLGSNGVKVVLSGAPNVSSVSDVTGSSNLKINDFYKDIEKNNPNVTLVDSMSGLLNQKNLVDETGFHLNEAGQTAFNAALSNAFLQSQGLEPIKYSEQAIKDFIVNNNLSLDQALSLAPSFSVSADRVRSALTGAPNAQVSKSNTGTIEKLPETQSFTLGQATLPGIEARTVDMGEGTRTEYYVKGTNIAVDAPNYYEDYFSGGPLTESSAPTLQQNNITIYDATRGGEYVYSPEGQYLGFQEGKRDSGLGGFVKEAVVGTAPIWMAALSANAGSLFGNAGAGAAAATDASFLAADAAQLAAQGLSESAIAQVLSAPGYASTAAANLAASMAVNGLDVGLMTQQLDTLSTNTGLMSQTGSAADFAAADALQLQGQVGNNFAAIEQNLIASGVDPLVAADISQQIAFNPGLTQADLATNLADSFGDNIYDVDVAKTYPTSTLPGEGGLLTDVVNTDVVNTDVVGTDLTTTATTGTGDSTLGTTLGGLTSAQIADLLKAGISLATISGAVNAAGGGGANTPMQTPTQGVPTNDPNYYNQLQQYYNAYLPQTPRDVVAPLQQWYEGSFGNTGTNTAVAPQQAQTAMPPAPTPVPMSMSASTGLFSTPMTAQQQVQNLLSNPNLSSLPPEAAAAINSAVSAPRNYNDVVASGGQNTVDVSSLPPEVQRAYDLYQQSMILGANSAEVRRAYERAGVNPANPDAFFESQGLLTGTPTQEALSQYAPLALDRFAKSGGGALTYTVDPSTLPSTYTAPTIPDISFNMDRFIQSINNNTTIGADAKQRIIAEQAAKRGFNPSEFI